MSVHRYLAASAVKASPAFTENWVMMPWSFRRARMRRASSCSPVPTPT
jgi:hypothetical protein